MRNEAGDADRAQFGGLHNLCQGIFDFSLGISKHFKLGVDKNTMYQMKNNSSSRW